MRRAFSVVIASAMLSAGCVTTPAGPHDRTLAGLNDPLYVLAAAVDVIVDDLPSDARDDQILSLATKGDPTLLDPFKEYSLKVKAEQSTAVILVCDKKSQVAYFEDVTCTPRLDTVRPTGSPCVFFLDVAKVCAENSP